MQQKLIEPILTTCAQEYHNKKYVGSQLFPMTEVVRSGGTIIEFCQQHFICQNTLRVPGKPTERIDLGSQSKKYVLEQESLEVKIPREHLAPLEEYPSSSLGIGAIQSVCSSLYLALEMQQAGIARNRDFYAPENLKKGDLEDQQWSFKDSSPLEDLQAAREIIRGKIGMYPNVFVISPVVFSALSRHPRFIERLSVSRKEHLTPEHLGLMMGVENVVIGTAIYSDSSKQYVDVWGKDAILAYVPQKMGTAHGMEEPSYGYTYTLQGNPFVEVPYFDGGTKSWIYSVTCERLPVLTSKDAGYLFSNMVA